MAMGSGAGRSGNLPFCTFCCIAGNPSCGRSCVTDKIYLPPTENYAVIPGIKIEVFVLICTELVGGLLEGRPSDLGHSEGKFDEDSAETPKRD